MDAGSEVNDELPMNTVFFGQMTPDTGVDQNGVVELRAGFLSVGSGGILDDATFSAADFTAAGYMVRTVCVALEGDEARCALGSAPAPPVRVTVYVTNNAPVVMLFCCCGCFL